MYAETLLAERVDDIFILGVARLRAFPMAKWGSIERAFAEAMLNPSRWNAAMEAVSDVMGERGAEAFARISGAAAADAAAEAFELSGIAVVLFNNAGEVIRLNRQAENVLGSGVCVVNGRLVAENEQATDEFNRALHCMIWTDGSVPPVQLPRPGRLPLLAYTLRLSHIAVNPLADCRALAILADPERRTYPPEAALCHALNLTEAEARLASRLAAGEAIETASSVLGIAAGTARNQLKSIFAKAGVRRQPELVALLTTLLGQFFGGA
jgi:DNA-binding CsgD family transcriptional regulator/PAS domain-containing protein